MSDELDTHLARAVNMCGFHLRGLAFMAADCLDRNGDNLADGFRRYSERCAAGDGCDQ